MQNPWDYDDEPPGKGNGDDEPATPRVPVRCPKCRKWAQARVRDGAVYCGACDQAFHPNFLDFLSGPTADDPPEGG